MTRLIKNFLIIFILFFSSLLYAETVNLKCKVNESNSNVNAKINIDEGFMEFGWIKYNITSVTETYITGIYIEEDDNVGGDIWVLNRIEGTYLRSYNWLSCVDDNCKKKRQLSSGVYSGSCKKKLL